MFRRARTCSLIIFDVPAGRAVRPVVLSGNLPWMPKLSQSWSFKVLLCRVHGVFGGRQACRVSGLRCEARRDASVCCYVAVSFNVSA